MSDKIHFIITGGTIDSLWDSTRDTVVVAKHTTLPEFFENLQRNLKLREKLVFTEICMKDSRDITQEDHVAILQAVANSDANKIIVTHGTYTMPETARYLVHNLTRKDQTIVLTGAFAPIKGFDFSDGSFNLGYALAQLQSLHAGVYICMNAQVFTAEEAAKNKEEGRFYSAFLDKQ